MRWRRAWGAIALIAGLAGTAAAGLTAAPGSPARATAKATAKPAATQAKTTPGRTTGHAPGVLPSGPGRDLTESGCLICHSAMLITQQHKDSTAWEKTVSLMEKWGAPVSPTARETLMIYLRRHFGVKHTP